MLKVFVTATLISILAMGSASALTVRDVTSSVGVRVTVKDGVATLYGHVDSNYEKFQAARAASQIEGVESVRNLLTF